MDSTGWIELQGTEIPLDVSPLIGKVREGTPNEVLRLGILLHIISFFYTIISDILPIYEQVFICSLIHTYQKDIYETSSPQRQYQVQAQAHRLREVRPLHVDRRSSPCCCQFVGDCPLHHQVLVTYGRHPHP